MKRALAILATLAVLVLAGLVIAKHTGVSGESGTELDALQPPVVAASPAAGEGAAGDAQAVSLDCVTAMAGPEANSQLLRQQRRLHIESHIRQQGGQLQRELVADLANYRKEDPPVLSNGLPADLFWRYAAPVPPGRRDLSYEERRRVANVFATEGVEGVVALGDASMLEARWDDTTLVGHLIEAPGGAFYAALPAVGSDLPIGLHELAKAIETGASPAEFAALLDVADVRPSVTWHNGANLAKLAAIHNRPGILRLLVEQGVDPASDPLWGSSRSVLDDVASRGRPVNTTGREAFADVARQLVLAGARPHLPSTMRALAEWVPDLPLTLDPDAALLLPTLKEAALALAGLDADWTRRVQAAVRLEERCEGQQVRLGHAAGESRGRGLAAKQRQQEALAKQEAEAWEALRRAEEDTSPGPPPGAGHEGLGAAFEVAFVDGRWDDAIALADELGGTTHLVLLLSALERDAPLDVLMALVDRNGGALPEHAALLLARSQRHDAAEVASVLEAVGFNPHYVDRQKRNAFHTLAQEGFEHEGAWRFAEYLASRAVSVKPSAIGLDPLDGVLMRLRDYPLPSQHNIRLARFLIDHGAPVEASHLQLAEQLSMRNERAYRRLVNIVPELAS